MPVLYGSPFGELVATFTLIFVDRHCYLVGADYVAQPPEAYSVVRN